MSQELVRKLKAVREKLGLSQAKFALKLGIPVRTLIGWENDQRTPRGYGLKALTEKLNAILAKK